MSIRQGILMNSGIKLIIIFVAMILLTSFNVAISQPSIPGTAAKELCEKIAKGRQLQFKGTRGEFFDGKNSWTIFGASQPDTESVPRSANWSVGSAPYQILTVGEPISDTRILPYSDPVPNTRNNGSIKINAWRGEYEPASFVLRSGDHPIRSIRIDIKGFRNSRDNGYIDPKNIDIRLVKCWYQACLDVRRKSSDKKRLTPELLLHDNDLVRVDHENKVNLVRNMANLQDADRLLAFDIPARTNQQLWITAQIPANSNPGSYKGTIELHFSVGEHKINETVPITLEVDQKLIPESPIEYALYYLARFDPLSKGIGTRGKNLKQMEAELRDMRAHGLTNVAVDYEYRKSPNGQPNYSRLTPVLESMRSAGFDTKRLLFVDWGVGGSRESTEYTNKLSELKSTAGQHGFSEIYVYNNDERDSTELLKNRKTFEIAHQLGMKNFVACSLRTAMAMKGLLDIAILPRSTTVKSNMTSSSVTGFIPWAYNDPQAGMETPATYRKVYGLPLLQDGYHGACNYAYQSGDCWDDWGDHKWRPHVMAYPTMTAPIPTVQWEGFREAIDDVRKSRTISAGIKR